MNKTKLNAWVHAARLRTLPLALSGIILASLIAFNQGQFHWDVFSLAIITTLLLQILSNLANDYGDYSHGTDNINRVGPERSIQSGIISPKEMKRAIYIIGLLAFHGGMFLLTASLDQMFDYVFILFLITGLVGIGAAIKYTIGKNPFGYKGFGDIMVFIFFGIAAVSGTHFLHTLNVDLLLLLPASAVGLLSAGVLNINNMRDIVNDKESNKITLAVRLGKTNSKIYHSLLIIISLGMLSLYLFIIGKNLAMASLIIPAIPLIIHLVNVLATKEPKNLDPELKRLSLSTLFISVWVGASLFV